MPIGRVAARIEESRSEADLLRDDFEAWLVRVVDGGGADRYDSQLNALARVFRSALSETRRRFLEGDVSGPAGAVIPDGAVYEECRRTDYRVILLHRLWRWYADRFDQRRGAVSSTLAAADEAVWSCWSGVWLAVTGGAPTSPPPLPYIEATYAAVATPRSEVPAILRLPRDPLLREWTARLPIPTIALPPIVSRRPWWLIVVAHEVGHHVQDDLLDESSPGRSLSSAVGAAAAGAGAGPEECESWEVWAREIFADAVALLLTGTAIVWAVEELDRRADERLTVADPANYPPPLTRWALLEELASRAGLPARTPAAATAAPAAPVTELQRRVPAVVDALLRHPVGDGCLERLREHTAGWQTDAMRWRTSLLGDSEPTVATRTESARLCVAGGVHAWQRLTAAGTANPQAQEKLVRRVRDVTAACRVPGLRAGGTADTASLDAVARQVIDDLFADIPRRIPEQRVEWGS